MTENTNPNQPGSSNDVAANADAVETDVDQLSQKLTEYENKLGEMRDVLLRERAEIENQRKRLQRGLAVDNADVAALREGMDLTLKALLKVAEVNGLKPIDPLGQPFDPERHQAMTMVAAPGKAPNTVVAVMQKGYALNDRLLRPALVAIAKAPDA